MKYLMVILVLICLCLSSCDFFKKSLCSAAVPGLTKVTQKVSERWECDFEKMFEFLVEPINEKFCTEDRNVKSLASPICNIAIGAISKLGSKVIATKFGCNAELVDKDFNNIDKLCSLI